MIIFSFLIRFNLRNWRHFRVHWVQLPTQCRNDHGISLDIHPTLTSTHKRSISLAGLCGLKRPKGTLLQHMRVNSIYCNFKMMGTVMHKKLQGMSNSSFFHVALWYMEKIVRSHQNSFTELSELLVIPPVICFIDMFVAYSF